MINIKGHAVGLILVTGTCIDLHEMIFSGYPDYSVFIIKALYCADLKSKYRVTTVKLLLNVTVFDLLC